MDFLEDTPEQGIESFRQGLTDPEPPAPAAPPPAPEPPAEPEAPPVAPDWLNAPPPQAPPQQYYEPPPQPQYQQPAYQPYVPPPQTKAGLEAFVDDPDSYINRLVEQRVAQAFVPLAYQQQAVAQMTNQMRDAQVRYTASQADSALKKAYEVFNQDKSFRTNKNIQNRIAATLSGLRQQALHAAQNGDMTQLYNLANMNEGHIRATIAAARALEGSDLSGTGPLQIEGATVESSRTAATPGPQVRLTAEEEEIARRVGGSFGDRLRKAKAEADKYGDFMG